MRESRERDGEIVVNWPASNVRATQPQRPPPPFLFTTNTTTVVPNKMSAEQRMGAALASLDVQKKPNCAKTTREWYLDRFELTI
jgi:hypothetical protein